MSHDRRFAHTLEGAGRDRWQTMEEHLDGVAFLAGKYAEAFGSGPWGELAGHWHDLGKYADDFQAYLNASSSDPEILDASVLDGVPKAGKRVDHSTAGAAFVHEKCAGNGTRKEKSELPATALALSMVIAGHHGGLPPRLNFENDRLIPDEKADRLKAAKAGGAPAELLDRPLPPPPDFLRPEAFKHLPTTTQPERDEKLRQFSLRHEFWTRMLFSALTCPL